jgi:hypothetical protein
MPKIEKTGVSSRRSKATSPRNNKISKKNLKQGQNSSLDISEFSFQDKSKGMRHIKNKSSTMNKPSKSEVRLNLDSAGKNSQFKRTDKKINTIMERTLEHS